MLRHFTSRRSLSAPTIRRRRRPSAARRSEAQPPTLEQLEERTLLSIFIVDRTDDTAAAAAQVCSGAANDCSLRGAIIKANGAAGADEIQFAASTNGTPFTLSIVGDEDAAAQGDLDVNGSLTITGNGSSNTIIQAGTNATNGIDKVFALNPTCAVGLDFTVSGVTVRFGRNTVAHDARFQDTGGGIDWCGSGTGANTPSLVLMDSVITQNSTLLNSGADSGHYGGGLNIDEVAPSNGIVTITNTTITNNTADAQGGGINIFGDNVQVTVSGSTISNNNTFGPGGIGAQGGGVNIRITNQDDGDGAPTPFVNIDDTTISGNTGVGFGGGVDVASAGNQDVTISNTAITGNSLIVVAGGVTNTTGGGIEHNNNPARTTTLTNVLIANNTSNGSTTSNGGGLAHGAGVLIVRNSTISGNSAMNDGGGVHMTTDPTLTLINTTISNNRADSDNNGTGTGGGINKLAGAGVLTLQNTISDGNFKGTGAVANEVAGTVTANFSLIGNTTGATLAGGSANNQLNVSGRLAALANNGGQSVGGGPGGTTSVLQTHALLAGSPAHDNGSNALVPGAITTDQRGTGFTRILDAADADVTDEVDIGSFEAHPAVEDVANQTINEDGSLMLTFNLGDADLTFDSVTAVSSNTTLVPNMAANISLSGSGSTRTLTVNQVANLFGTTTITLTVTDTVAGTTQMMSDTIVLTVDPVADTPSVTNATTDEDVQTSGAGELVVSRNPVDGAEVTHFKITSIMNGSLFQNDGTTPITNNSFITFAQANAGLKFTPAANLFSPTTTFSFGVQASLSNMDAGLGGSVVTAMITVNPVADTPSVTNATTFVNTQTTSGLVISRNPVDGAEVTHFKITAIMDGSLFQNDGTTPIANNEFITFAQANAGLRFTPASDFIGTAHFTVQASLSNMDSGLGGSTVTADIIVTASDLTATKSNDAGGGLALGNSFMWRVNVTNGGAAPAEFSAAATILSDNLPDANIGYGAPSVANQVGVTGTINCAIVTNDLSCTAVGAVSIAIGGSFDVQFTATPSAAGTFDNPRAGGSCATDPDGSVPESAEGNNACSNSVVVTQQDFGDAPSAAQSGFASSYPTTGASAARHIITGARLGAAVDFEADGQPTAGADGDDLAGTADEDGADLLATAVALAASPTTASVAVSLQNAANALLDGWIDFNLDGDWLDPNEQIFTNQAVSSGDNTLSYTIPAGATPGNTFARLRVSSLGNLLPTGLATDGEIEDYPIALAASGADAIVQAVADGGAVAVRFMGGNTIVRQGGIDLFSVPTVSINSLTVEGTAGNDSFVLELTAGNPVPVGGITFNGRSQTSIPGDSLAIVDGSFTTATYNYTNANDGNVQLDPDGPGGTAPSTVNYTGLEPLSNSGTAADIIFNLPAAGPNTGVVLGDDADAGDGESQIAGATFESTVFANPTNSLTISLGNAGDTITVNSMDSTFNPAAGSTIGGGTSGDTFHIRASLASGVAIGLTVNAGNGDDVFNVGSAANSLDGFSTILVLRGEGGSSDTMNVNDQGDGDGNSYSLSNTTLGRSFIAGLDFVTVESVVLNASGLANTITMASSLAAVSTTVNAGGGSDIINLGIAGSLDELLGPVTINGGAPGLPGTGDQLIVNDQSDGDVNNYTVTPTTVARTGIPTINYATIETVIVNGDNNSAPVDVGSTFNVTPSLITAITVNGNDPAPPATPGDSLIVDFSGTTGAMLTPMGPGAGQFTFTSFHQPVSFTGIETLQPDLTATKTNNVGGATTFGNSWTWTIDVANSGGSDATFAMGQTIVSDNLPNMNIVYGAPVVANATNVTGSVNIECTIVANDLNCTAALGAVTIGAFTGSFDVQFTATPSDAGTFANPRSGGNCAVDPSNNVMESVEGNNACSDSVTVSFTADVSITKTDSPDPVLAGNALTYTLTVSNAGPEPATDVMATDVLPTELTGATFCTGAGCDPSMGTAWTGSTSLGTIASGANVVIIIRATVDPNTANGTMLSNTATVTTSSIDTVPGNNSDTETTTVNTEANLSITKSDSPDPVIAGTNLTYTLTTTNSGPSDAQAVQIVDATPANTTFVSATPSAGGTCMTPAVGGTGTVTCDFAGATAPAGTRSMTLVVNVNANAASGSTISNTATTSSTTTDPNAANNSATAMTTVNTAADLSITKADAPDPVIAGTNETYTITATNNGPSDAQAVQIVDVTPTSTTFVSATPSAGGSCTTPAVGGTGTVTCTWAGATAPAGTRSVTLVVNVNANAANLSTISDTATTSSSTADPNAANNSDTETTTISTEADLSITKADLPDPAIAGNDLTYTLMATNNGPSDAQGVQIVDVVPANTTFVSATPSAGGTCMTPAVGGTGTVTCDWAGATAAGGTRTLTLVVNVNANTSSGSIITNTATTSSLTTDPNPANNSDTEPTDVLTAADLAVIKTDSPDPVIAGTNETYTITMANNGASDAQTVSLADATPLNTTFVSFMQTSGPAFIIITPPVGGAGTVTATTATLPAGASATFTFVVNVNASTPNGTLLSNTATATTNTTDPNAANSSDTEVTTVNTEADLVVTKADTPDPVIAGTNETYTIVLTNSGPSDAQTVSLTDVVPANTTFVSYMQNSGPAFTLMTPPVGGAGTVTASSATFAAGASASFTLVVKVSASAANLSLISNSATGASATTDPTPANNSDTESTTVNTQADLSITKTDSPDPVFAGNNLTYTLTTTNNGPSDAQAVQIADATPANTTFVSATPSAGGSCTTPAVGGTGTVTCTWAGGTAAGSMRSVTLVVHLNANTPGASIITDTATTSSSTTDPNAANDSATTTTTVNTQADVSVTKTDSPDPVTIGTNLTFTVTVTNNGPSDAQAVSLMDAVPANTTFASNSGAAGWTCMNPAVGGTGTIACTNPTLAAGATSTFTIVVHVNAAAPNGSMIANTATVAATTTDPAAGNNSATSMTLAQALDYGDAPDPLVATPGRYPTLQANNGARHIVGSGLFLGASVETDNDGQPNATATGDDTTDGTDDEDGVALPATLVARLGATVTVTASLAGKLDAWVDFNRDGDWTNAGEQIATNLAVVAGANSVSFAVPVIAVAGTSFARFRLSSAGGLAPTGQATDGEVEDYSVQIVVAADSSATLFDDPLNPGQKVLLVLGSPAVDKLSFKATGGGSLITVKRNNRSLGSFDATQIDRIVAFGLAGNDSIKMNSNVNIDAQLHGGDGIDSIRGGGTNTIVLGGAGNDVLRGGSNRNLLIGGGGVDKLTGGNDILIGGTTAYDANDQALTAILAEWKSATAYNDRVTRLRAGTGVPKLDATTVFDDLLANQLNGGGGMDWFFKGDNDRVKGRSPDEFQDVI